MAVTTVFPPFLPHDGKMAAADPDVTQQCPKHSSPHYNPSWTYIMRWPELYLLHIPKSVIVKENNDEVVLP